MTNNNFVPLHNHCSIGSFLDGYSRPEHLVARMKELGITSIGLTDHGEVAGLPYVGRALREAGFKLVMGMEGYLCHYPTVDQAREAKDPLNSHYCIWAETQEGYRNLLSLSSLGYTEGLYYKPQVTWSTLGQYSKGLIASDGCMLSNSARFILKGESDNLRGWVGQFLETFGEDNFFLELHTWQFTNPQSEKETRLNQEMATINQGKVKLAKEMGLPMIVVNDSHMSSREDGANRRLIWDMSTQADPDKSEGKSETADWIMSDEEILYWMSKHGVPSTVVEEAIANTGKIAERCHAEIPYGQVSLPHLTGTDEGDLKLYNESFERGLREKVIPRIEKEVKSKKAYRLTYEDGSHETVLLDYPPIL